jgi:DNA transformation protein and related proteins
MTNLTSVKLYVGLSASEARRRLKGHGFGIRKVESAGKNRALIIHTATGYHRRRLEALFHDEIQPVSQEEYRD